MPDYVVLISTLGGIEIFGMNGIVLGPLIAAMFTVLKSDEFSSAFLMPFSFEGGRRPTVL